MRFWDSSALLPLIVSEPRTPEAISYHASDSKIAVWWGSEVECRSAIVRKFREGTITPSDLVLALQDLASLLQTSSEVLPLREVKLVAGQIIERHPLRAADALQLAAASIWREHWQRPIEFVCFDLRLREAATADNFQVLPTALQG